MLSDKDLWVILKIHAAFGGSDYGYDFSLAKIVEIPSNAYDAMLELDQRLKFRRTRSVNENKKIWYLKLALV